MEIFFSLIRFIFLFFFPGFLLSLALFDEKRIDPLARIVLSFGLSIALVPMSVFYLHLIGMPITVNSVSIVVISLCGIGLIGWSIRLWRKYEKK